jgi:hypothetical protein
MAGPGWNTGHPERIPRQSHKQFDLACSFGGGSEMTDCPKCGTTLPTAKLILPTIDGLRCPGCNSHLKVSGIKEASRKTGTIALFTFFPVSWPLFWISVVFLGGVFIHLVRKFAKVTIVE